MLDQGAHTSASSSALAEGSTGSSTSADKDSTPRTLSPGQVLCCRSKSQAYVAALLQCATMGAASDRGARSLDAHHHRAPGHLFAALCDGCAGDPAAKLCRLRLNVLGVAVSEVGDAAPPARATGSPGPAPSGDAGALRALSDGLAQTERELLASGGLGKANVLAVLVQAGGRAINVAWTGDCQAFLCRDGRAVSLTGGQRGDAADAAPLETHLAGASRFRGGQAAGLGSSLGFDQISLGAVPTLRSESLYQEDEFVLLGTRALWDAVPGHEAVRLARSLFLTYEDPQTVAEKLVEYAAHHGRAGAAHSATGSVAVQVIRLFPPLQKLQQPGREPCCRRVANGTRPGFLDIPTMPNFSRVIGGF